MDSVFVDTGAFIALAAANDPNHESAKSVYEALIADRTPLVLTNHVVDETCTWLLRDRSMGHRAACVFGEFLRANAEPLTAEAGSPRKLICVLYSGPDIENRAWEIFRGYPTSGFTFTDCVSFAVMQHLGITWAFTYASHFDMLGFQRIG